MLALLIMVLAALWLAWKLTRRLRSGFAEHNNYPNMSAETASSLFPDRPIRPLPKRRLRERLSPEAAESIQYPQPPQSSNSLFSYPYSLRSDDSDSPLLAREGAPDAGSTSPMNLTTEEEEVAALRRDLVNRMPPDLSGPGSRPSLKTDHGRQTNAPPHPLSAVSSVDGYDQLENANNKKKRKIPTAGDATLNGVHALAESGLAPLTISGSSQSIDASDERASPSTPYQGSGNLGAGSQNLAGPGRGRYGRPRSGRSPLRPLCDSTNNWAGRNGKARPYQWSNSTSKWIASLGEHISPQLGQNIPPGRSMLTSMSHRREHRYYIYRHRQCREASTAARTGEHQFIAATDVD